MLCTKKDSISSTIIAFLNGRIHFDPRLLLHNSLLRKTSVSRSQVSYATSITPHPEKTLPTFVSCDHVRATCEGYQDKIPMLFTLYSGRLPTVGAKWIRMYGYQAGKNYQVMVQ